MADPRFERTTDVHPPSEFGSTQWSVVLAAGNEDSAAREALAALCGTYWYPVFAFIRRRCGDADKAGDLAQEFFARLLEKQTHKRADPGRGRFRAFLLTAVKNFLANQRDYERAAKRGGQTQTFSLDVAAAESRFAAEPAAGDDTPERQFERRWALALLDRVLARLEAEHETAGKAEQFQQLKLFLTGQNESATYADAAVALGISPDAARAAAHRLRTRYRRLLTEEVARTVARPDEVENELRDLFTALRR